MSDHPTDADEPTPSQQVATAHAVHIHGEERRQWARVLMLGAALVFVVATVAGLGLQNRNLAEQNVALSKSRLVTAREIKEQNESIARLLELGDAVTGPAAVAAQADTLNQVLAIVNCDNRAALQELLEALERQGAVAAGTSANLTCPERPPAIGGGR